MQIHVLGSVRRWRVLGALGLTLGLACAPLASCNSSSSQPPELAATEDATRAETAPDTGPEVAARDASDASDAADVEAEPICVPMLDEAGSGASVSPDALSFGTMGLVPCGGQGTPLTTTLANTTCAPFTWTATLTTGSMYYAVSPSMGTLMPGETVTVQVTPNGIPMTSSVAAGLYDGTLSINTNAPNDGTHAVPLHMTAQGVILATTLVGSSIGFGSVAVGDTGTAQLTVENNGNVSVTPALVTTTKAFTVSTVSAIAGGASATPTITFAPAAVQPYTDTLSMSVPSGTVLCGAVPGAISLSGTGQTGVSVSSTSLDFGPVNCGAAAAPYKTLTIANTGAAATFTPTLTDGVNYTLTDGSGNAIASGSSQTLGPSATIRVVPNAITAPASTAANAFGDTLTITTTASGDTPHTVMLLETAQGAVFTLSPPNVTVNVSGTNSTFVGFTVANTGNYSAGYTLVAAPAAEFSTNLTGGTLGAAGTASASETGQLTCTGAPLNDAGEGSQVLGTLTLTPASGSVLCADPPSPMPLSVTN